MSRVSRNIAIIIRSERLIARRHIAVAMQRAGIAAAAAVLGATGLIMLNAAAYLALSERIDPALAALIVAVANLVLALLLILVVRGMSADRDLYEVCEVRDMAVADLETEIQDAGTEARGLAQDLRALLRNPLGTAGASVIGPLISVLIKQLRK